jgi:hypothetical protein
MLKFCRIVGLLVFLALIFVSCGAGTTPSVTSYYTIKNGVRATCTLDTCTSPAYAVGDDGVTYYCRDKNPDNCIAVTPTPERPCKPAFAYDTLIDGGKSWKVIPPQQQGQNNSTSPAQVTFTSKTSATITVTDSLSLTTTTTGSLSGSLGVIKATITESVKTTIDTSVSSSVTASIGNDFSFTVPAGDIAYANYGVRVQITSGHLYDKAGCEGPGKKSDWGTDITYVPIGIGWCVWTSKQPPCPSV